jgi:hypothetical protein
MVKEGEYGTILCTHVCKWKMISVETTPGMGEGEIKENDGGVNSTTIYLINCKNLCKCHNVPPSCTIKNKTEMSYMYISWYLDAMGKSKCWLKGSLRMIA